MTKPFVLSMKRLLELVVTIPETRRTLFGNFQHSLANVLSIALMAIVSGFYTWEDIAAYAQGKKEFLKTVLDIKDDVPSQHSNE